MKRFLLVAVAVFITFSTHCQVIKVQDLEKYAVERYGNTWQTAASNLATQLVLDKNNSLTYTEIIDCGEQTKEQLYVKLNYWFTATFTDENSVIQLNDKENGVIIGRGFVEGIAEHIGGMNRYYVNIRPVIKVDIKDKKIRVTYTIQYYDVEQIIGGGYIGSDEPVYNKEKWAVESCYPFVKKDYHKKTSSKAFVMTHAYSNVIMDMIKEVVQNGLIGNENDEW